jgi:hypothetical protein
MNESNFTNWLNTEASEEQKTANAEMASCGISLKHRYLALTADRSSLTSAQKIELGRALNRMKGNKK